MSNLALNKESLAQVYIDQLDLKLKAAENRLREMNAHYQSAQNAYSEAKAWEDKIKKYWESIQRTEDLADVVVADLQKLANQIDCVCRNARHYTDAVKILICCVKEVGDILEEISGEMRDLMARIDCGKSKEPALDSSKSILKCLEEYRAKLDAALKQSLETLRLALTLLKTAQLVLNEKRSLEDFIAYLWTHGGGGDSASEYLPQPSEVDSDCYTEPGESDPSPDNCTVVYVKPCPDPGGYTDGKNVYPDVCAAITLQIELRQYYLDTEAENEVARKTRQDFEIKLNEVQQARDGAQAKRDSAFKALADAKKAKECN